jgi:hypothetical protein
MPNKIMAVGCFSQKFLLTHSTRQASCNNMTRWYCALAEATEQGKIEGEPNLEDLNIHYWHGEGRSKNIQGYNAMQCNKIK